MVIRQPIGLDGSLARSRYVSRVEDLLQTIYQVVVVLEQYVGWEIALARDTWNAAVETQLTADFVALVPSSSHLRIAHMVWCHANVNAAFVSRMLCPPVR